MSDKVSVSPKYYQENGIACKFDDESLGEVCDKENKGKHWYFAAPLKFADGDFEPGSRQVWAVYSHQNVAKYLGDLQLNFGAISYSTANDPIAWQRHTNEEGEQLIMNDQDATSCTI
ncbi:hypothetical protein [Natrinema versiforme]|uniref:Uncharacterized protein n=1 Tax=Natrinema versiforme TaxID=88724 RepID=A0A4V6MBF7_9EURY|nr:hypothetical protein [Natrinema versiforme]QCS40837.1 hypothetical protein FEJ81_00185 [Natrinema versiforme]